MRVSVEYIILSLGRVGNNTGSRICDAVLGGDQPRVVLPQFSSVRFSDIFCELRTELSVQFRHLAELWTEPSVQVQRGSVQVQGGFEPRTEHKFT